MNQNLVTSSIELYNNGLSYEQIARKIGKSKKWVLNKLKDKIIPRLAKRKKIVHEKIIWSTINERDQLIFSLYKEYGAHIISKKLGISKRTIFKVLGNNIDKDRKNILVTSEMKNQIIELYESNHSMSEIAIKFNLSSEAIKYHLKSARTSFDALRSFPTTIHDEVCQLYKDGMSTYDLSDWLNEKGYKTHPNSLSSFLQRKGIIRTHKEAKVFSAIRKTDRLTPSRLENKVKKILESLNIKYEQQFALNGWNYDFKIDNWLIEVQGDYFHRLPGRPNRDIKKYENAINNNYKMIYLWEHEINEKLELAINRLKCKLFDQHTIIDFNNLYIVEIKWNIASEFLEKYHYQGKGRSGTCYGLFYNKILIAVCVFSSVIRLEVAKKQNLMPSQILELSRLCIDPDYQAKNLATYFISRCRKLVRISHENLKCLVAFSDLSYGHTGAIYKADNWINDGMTDSGYWYFSKNRCIIHKKTVWNNAKKSGISESEYSKLHNLRKVKGSPKIRFLYRY